MNNETCEALKRVVGMATAYSYSFNEDNGRDDMRKDLKQVETWIDEVAKEYEPTDMKGKPYKPIL